MSSQGSVLTSHFVWNLMEKDMGEDVHSLYAIYITKKFQLEGLTYPYKEKCQTRKVNDLHCHVNHSHHVESQKDVEKGKETIWKGYELEKYSIMLNVRKVKENIYETLLLKHNLVLHRKHIVEQMFMKWKVLVHRIKFKLRLVLIILRHGYIRKRCSNKKTEYSYNRSSVAWKKIQTFRRKSSNIPGMSSNIPGNVAKHSAKCRQTLRGMFPNIPENVAEHFGECRQTFRGM